MALHIYNKNNNCISNNLYPEGFEVVTPINDHLFVIKNNKHQYFFLNKLGEDPLIENFIDGFQSHVTTKYKFVIMEKKNKFHLFKTKGKIVTWTNKNNCPGGFDNIQIIYEDLILVENNNKQFFIDKFGDTTNIKHPKNKIISNYKVLENKHFCLEY